MAKSGVRKKGKGLGDLKDDLRRLMRAFKSEETMRELANFLRRRADEVIEDPASFDFTTEPKWEARKEAAHGPKYAQLPLAVPNGSLQSSLTEPGGEHIEEVEPGGLRLGSKVDIADLLLNKGGTNPLGEPFPARDPYDKIPSSEVEEEISRLQLPMIRDAVRVGTVV